MAGKLGITGERYAGITFGEALDDILFQSRATVARDLAKFNDLCV